LSAWACGVLAGAGAPSKDEQQIVALEREWADAEVKHDSAALERILDDRFVATFATGKPLDKHAFIAQAMKFSFTSQSVAHDVIQIYGDTAVIVGMGTGNSRSADGKEQAQTFRYTAVFQKRQGRWFAIAEQVGTARAVDLAGARPSN
jgi:ketosteroid isomerase-like protein